MTNSLPEKNGEEKVALEKKPVLGKGLSFGKPKNETPKAEKAEKAEKVKKPKAEKAKKASKGEKVKPEPNVDQKSILKMSPQEIKEYFSKRKGNSEPIVPIEDMVFIAKKPEVNLLPQEVLDGYTASSLKFKYLKIGAVVVVVFLALFGVSTLSHALSQGEIEKLGQEAVDANVQIRGLQPYEMYKTTVEEKREALSGQMQKNLDVSGIMNSLNKVGSDTGIKFTKMSLDTASTDCVSPDPFNTVTTIGCLTFSAEGSGADSVVNFYSATKDVKGFVNPYLPGDGAVAKEGKSTMEGSIGITQDFYSSVGTDELSTPIDTILEANAAKKNAQPAETEKTDGQ